MTYLAITVCVALGAAWFRQRRIANQALDALANTDHDYRDLLERWEAMTVERQRVMLQLMANGTDMASAIRSEDAEAQRRAAAAWYRALKVLEDRWSS